MSSIQQMEQKPSDIGLAQNALHKNVFSPWADSRAIEEGERGQYRLRDLIEPVNIHDASMLTLALVTGCRLERGASSSRELRVHEKVKPKGRCLK
ncbi:uncharacterized protein ACLA_009240 [Aspergillus clavatus NRRL 1]|uniref:Uncharacterized protein n=1 Tax=Aspergillus clavatus (strain ATCC 1007 / CBS 513.65 / DSM 816 / NCTC 3887 / NRRL 1 / QM 1276 / 107) TaxID=344612 RepID=A1C9T6_ASPCL|nr:uncharacterized protein ACLA_009240 [Aspergillus clavatus NRRL 1]EAW12504.1 hypothetical protein ACLA_009240 [Aspergillus clavatus NRRL 1]